MGVVVSSLEIIGEWLRTVVTPTTLGTLNADITASATSVVLAAGYTGTLPAGVWAVKIGSEVLHATQTGDTLTVETGTRGSHGTTAAAHLAGASVTQANFASVVGNNVWERGFPQGFIDSPVAATLYHIVGGQPKQLYSAGVGVRSSVRKPRVLLRCYGGPDSEGNYTDVATDMVYKLLAARLEAAPMEAVASGVVMSVVEDGEGQILTDPDTQPPWPYILTFAEMEIRAA